MSIKGHEVSLCATERRSEGMKCPAGKHLLRDRKPGEKGFRRQFETGGWTPCQGFLPVLSNVFDKVAGHIVEFENPIQGNTASNGVYIAQVV